MDTLVLKNETLTAIFSKDSAALVGLTHKHTGWDLIRRAELGLSFRLQVPKPDQEANFVLGETQTVSAVKLSEDGTAVTFRWDALTDESGESLDIAFTSRVSLSDEGLRFEAEVRNDSQYPVDVVAYPCVGDITRSSEDRKLQDHSVAWESLVSQELMPKFPNAKGYWGTYNPTVTTASTNGNLFTLLAEDDRGFYFGVHETTNREMVHWFYEYKPGYRDFYEKTLPDGDEIAGQAARMEMMMQHFTFIAPGSTYSISPCVIQPYTGGWQAGIDVYRQWRKTWFKAPRRPAWLDEVHSWLQIQIYSAGDRANFRYADLPEIARECKEYGIKAIQVTGWAEGGQDRGNPSHSIDPALGTLKELQDAIAECEEMGVKVILFTKWTWIDASSDWFTRGDAFKHTAKNPFGQHYPAGGYQYYSYTQLAGLNTRPLIPTCTASPEWRKIAEDEFRKVLETGTPGMLFDECQHHGSASYCFDPDHDHPTPAYLYGYDVELARGFKKLSDEKNPDFLYSGELCYDLQMQEYHLIYNRFEQGHVPGYRYLDPNAQIMMFAPGFDDRNQINKHLEYRYILSYEPYHFKGRPSDAPKTIEYGRMVDDLRRKYRNFLWDGEFRSHLGATVTIDSEKSDDFSVFRDRESGKRAVVICNIDDQKTVRAGVQMDDGNADLLMATPEVPEAQPACGEIGVPPRSVVVLMEA